MGMDYYQVLDLTRGADVPFSVRTACSRSSGTPTRTRATWTSRPACLRRSPRRTSLSSKKLRAVYDKFGEEGSRPPRSGVTTPSATRVHLCVLGTELRRLDGPAGPTDPSRRPASEAPGDGPAKAPAVISSAATLQELYGVHKAPQQSPPSAGGRTDAAKRAEVPRGPRAARVARGHKVTFENEGDERAGGSGGRGVYRRRTARGVPPRGGVHLLRAHPARQRADGFLQVDHLDGRVLNIPCNEVIRPGASRRCRAKACRYQETGARGNSSLSLTSSSRRNFGGAEGRGQGARVKSGCSGPFLGQGKGGGKRRSGEVSRGESGQFAGWRGR